MRPGAPPPHPRQRGAALLIAMLLLSLVATVASAMVWQHWRALQVEQAERARAQAGWILQGALDWARLILREDARNSQADHLGEPWAVPLAEARLSTFLAAERDGTTGDDGGPEAFLSGQISDAQALFNLRNLVVNQQVSAPDLKALQKLCTQLGLDPLLADRLAQAMLDSAASVASALLPPQRLDDLAWLLPGEPDLAALQPHLVLLPSLRTPVNLNTASREVLAAVVDGLDLGGADRLVQQRQSSPFKALQDAQALMPSGVQLNAQLHSVASSHFVVRGRLRLEQRVLEESSVVLRNGQQVSTLLRQRHSLLAGDR